MSGFIPSPAMPGPLTASALVERIRANGGRIFTSGGGRVFVLTTSEDLADWLLLQGGSAHETGRYLRARNGTFEWDINIDRIEVAGHEPIVEAARR